MGTFVFSATAPARVFAAAAGVIAGASRGIWTATVRWSDRRRAAAHLRGLDDAFLRDIGLHRSEIDSVVYYGRSDGSRRMR